MLTHIQEAAKQEGERGAEKAHDVYGCFLLVTPPPEKNKEEEEEEERKEEEEEGEEEEEEEEEAVVGHLDGRDYLTEAQLLALGKAPTHPPTHSFQEAKTNYPHLKFNT